MILCYWCSTLSRHNHCSKKKKSLSHHWPKLCCSCRYKLPGQHIFLHIKTVFQARTIDITAGRYWDLKCKTNKNTNAAAERLNESFEKVRENKKIYIYDVHFITEPFAINHRLVLHNKNSVLWFQKHSLQYKINQMIQSCALMCCEFCLALITQHSCITRLDWKWLQAWPQYRMSLSVFCLPAGTHCLPLCPVEKLAGFYPSTHHLICCWAFGEGRVFFAEPSGCRV